MCAQAHYQVKVSLVGIGLALFAHVVRSGLTEVQPTHRHLAHCFTVQFDANQTKDLKLRQVGKKKTNPNTPNGMEGLFASI